VTMMVLDPESSQTEQEESVSFQPSEVFFFARVDCGAVHSQGEGRIGLFCGGDPINGVDSDGRCIEATGNFLYNGGVAGYTLNGIGNTLNNSFNNNSYLGASASFVGTLFNEAGSAVSPSTYVNGLSSFGNNVSSVYQSDGIWAAGSYATTSWNVGAVYSGVANINLATGAPVGDWFDRGEDGSGEYIQKLAEAARRCIKVLMVGAAGEPGLGVVNHASSIDNSAVMRLVAQITERSPAVGIGLAHPQMILAQAHGGIGVTEAHEAFADGRIIIQ